GRPAPDPKQVLFAPQRIAGLIVELAQAEQVGELNENAAAGLGHTRRLLDARLGVVLREMLQNRIREHDIEGPVRKRQASAVTDDEPSRLAQGPGNAVGGADGLEARVDANRLIAALRGCDAPAPPVTADVEQPELLRRLG